MKFICFGYMDEWDEMAEANYSDERVFCLRRRTAEGWTWEALKASARTTLYRNGR